jgi:flagellar biosynthetic protein FliQ
MMRRLLIEALLLSAPMLVGAAVISLIVSLLQTLTSVQEQTLTAVPRLLVVFAMAMVTMPWTVHRLVNFTVHLWTGLQRYLG